MENESMKQMRMVPDPSVARREINDQVFALTPATWELHQLNEVATRIWELAESRPLVSEVIDALAKEYEVSEEVLEKDCLAFVSVLVEKGLVSLMPA